ncbi:ABC transporter permease [Alsobacter metallidurans]|uniref:ABC transporter permease n=1 Tax=Alsobacter metallidurans TaxID=340221 RepID=A0A917I5E1_9HYPH|nr:ABC transporter permease [Alsobacter metallidurans]GGH16456.1 ABC transporter permease [Alsobacter metallidurans]
MKAIIANRLALVGAIITAIVLAGVIVGPWLSPYSPTDADFMALLDPPSGSHPFGTDSFGRDVLTRILYGARVSLTVSISGVLAGALIGTTAGLVAAYFGGWWQAILMRVSDLLFSFPSFVLALFLMVVLGFGVVNIAVAIALIYAPIFARLSRNMAVLVKDEPWVQAAALMGQSTWSIITREILPNIAAPVFVQVALAVAFGIVIEAGLSFLGLGVQPPNPSLGSIMADGREYFSRAPWVLTLSGVAISVALLGLNLLSDGVRDLMDPKLRARL